MFSDLWIRELELTEVKKLTGRHKELLNDITILACCYLIRLFTDYKVSG